MLVKGAKVVGGGHDNAFICRFWNMMNAEDHAYIKIPSTIITIRQSLDDEDDGNPYTWKDGLYIEPCA